MKRRTFLQRTSAAALLTAAPSALELSAKATPSNRLQAGMIGAAGRAGSLNRYFADNPEVDIAAIAEIDPKRLPGTLEAVTRLQGRKPKVVTDYRHIIDDPKLDVIVVGTPDHWHAIPTIQACQTGKDVYVEKPDANNIVEGRRMIAAANKHQRIVQVGSQHRSTQRIISAMEYIRKGHLGKCLVAKAWEVSGKARSAIRPTVIRLPALTTTSGSARHQNDHSIATVSTVVGVGFTTTGPATSAMTASIAWISPSPP